jgi:redox-sensitive bicupin YhaK (pirin superfamily)
MRVPPHPHIGLQTVTWLLSGNVLHRDSLGSEQMIRPGQLNLMTAGRGIAHSEESPVEHDPLLHGVQLWVALPDAVRHTEPAFAHHADLPAVGIGGFEVTVFAGSLAGARSPALMFSEIVGAELVAARDVSGNIPLADAHEHVVFAAAGSAAVAGTVLQPGQLMYLSTGRDRVSVSAPEGSRLFLLGGVPLGETLLMWWNLVARTPDEIAAAAADWREGRFAPVADYDGAAAPGASARRRSAGGQAVKPLRWESPDTGASNRYKYSAGSGSSRSCAALAAESCWQAWIPEAAGPWPRSCCPPATWAFRT